MKTAILLCVLANSAFAGTPVLAHITPEALALLQQNSPMAALPQPPPSEAVVSRSNDRSIIKQSTILHDGKNWTLIPRGAVIFLPEPMKGRVAVKPVGNFLAWTDFLEHNQHWITTTETSFDQAAGTIPLQAEQVAVWAKQEKLVIAVHQDGPISVRVASGFQAITQR